VTSPLLKAGEFARLCGSTKETLRHYHGIGLLTPAETAPNGYKLYGPAQVADFMLIDALRRAGRSLVEIRDYLAAPDAEALAAVLEDCLTRLDQERDAIARTRRALSGTLARLRLLDAAQSGPQVTVDQCPAERFILTPIKPPAGAGADQSGAALSYEWGLALIATLRDHIEHCRGLGQETEFQSTYRIGREAFLAGDYFADFSICNPAPAGVRTPRLHVKPAGAYLKLLRRLSLDPEASESGVEDLIFEAYDDLKRHAADGGYRVAGDAYETELSIYTGAFQGTLAAQVAVLVEPEHDQSA
jgi:DNA-binding transcriptional MerR regulator